MKTEEKRPSKTTRRTVWVCALLVGLFSVLSAEAWAATAREIDTSVDVAYERFIKNVQGAAQFAESAKGMLILPHVRKVGFGLGGQYGQGALRVGGQTVGYYNIIAGSFGLQIGVQQKDIIIAFMSDEALKGFQAGRGWEAGVDGNIAFITMGAGRSIDTTTARDPIVGFIFNVKGLMADLSLKGAKFTKIIR